MKRKDFSMKDRFYIDNPRQMRAIAALLEKPILVSSLGSLIGSLNARQTISELRQQGYIKIIKTRRFTVIDQDGRQCRPGQYFIPEDSKPIVEKALGDYFRQTNSKGADTIKRHVNFNFNRGE